MNNQKGFALFEVLLSTLILCGLIYVFMSFFQTQQRQVLSQNAAKHVTIAMNTLMASVAKSGACPNEAKSKDAKLTVCLQLKPGFAEVLKDDGFNPDSAQVTISP